MDKTLTLTTAMHWIRKEWNFLVNKILLVYSWRNGGLLNIQFVLKSWPIISRNGYLWRKILPLASLLIIIIKEYNSSAWKQSVYILFFSPNLGHIITMLWFRNCWNLLMYVGIETCNINKHHNSSVNVFTKF